jgi:hypothetical protein
VNGKEVNEEGKKGIGLLILAAALVALCLILSSTQLAFAPTALAQDNQTIVCNVTVGSISISLNVSEINYGILLQGDSNTSGMIQATNTGDGAAEFNIRGANATRVGGGGEWAIDCTPGENAYTHEFYAEISTNSGCLSTDNQALNDNVEQDAFENFQLTITLPETITNPGIYTTQVTVQASAAA